MDSSGPIRVQSPRWWLREGKRAFLCVTKEKYFRVAYSDPRNNTVRHENIIGLRKKYSFPQIPSVQLTLATRLHAHPGLEAVGDLKEKSTAWLCLSCVAHCSEELQCLWRHVSGHRYRCPSYFSNLGYMWPSEGMFLDHFAAVFRWITGNFLKVLSWGYVGSFQEPASYPYL